MERKCIFSKRVLEYTNGPLIYTNLHLIRYPTDAVDVINANLLDQWEPD
jgi:hypothetical protein